MDFVNETKFPAGWTLGFERDGRELVVVMVKATFVIPPEAGNPIVADEHIPLTEEDQFTGEPGLSAPLRETDYAHRKPVCDVLLNGTAYVPGANLERRLVVGMRVGQMVKGFTVVGNRVWRRGVASINISAPERFSRMPISYDCAFGGVDQKKDRPDEIRTFMENPVGRGYSYFKEDLDGKPLPNTEMIDVPIEDPGGAYRPMGFGAIGRNWQPRTRFAGTYDQAWIEQRAPFWPDDFDYRYFQAAPADQHIPYPTGGEDVVLKNLTPNGRVAFRLPMMKMPVLFIPRAGKDHELAAVVDTLLIEPDLGTFTMTWRAALPLRRNCFEIRQVIVGEMPREWHQARRFHGKPYYKGLAELVRARSGL